RDLRCTQVTLGVTAQADDGALRIHALDLAGDDGALFVRGGVVGERITGELLHAEGNALALGVDRQHHGFDLVALLVAAHGFLARLAPRKVRQVHQAVDAARQPDEHAEVGDRLDLATDLVALLMRYGEVFPGIRLALLHAERDAAALFVDLE